MRIAEPNMTIAEHGHRRFGRSFRSRTHLKRKKQKSISMDTESDSLRTVEPNVTNAERSHKRFGRHFLSLFCFAHYQ